MVSVVLCAGALAAQDTPELWINCSSDKEVQAKFDIMQENTCKSKVDIYTYNRFISRVLYEYLQKNEPGKENRLVENFNDWYSKTAEKLQKVEKGERNRYLVEASIEYIKPITEEIEGKFANACEYAQYLFTHARYMLNFFPSTEYKRQIDGVVYRFTQFGNRCLSFVAYPIDKERTYENSTIIALDGKRDLYDKECIRGTSLEYNGGLYRLISYGIDWEESKKVLYELEQNKLNYKSVCEIK
jgi:hypothetical protein